MRLLQDHTGSIRKLVNCFERGELRSENDCFDHVEMKFVRFKCWGKLISAGRVWMMMAFCTKLAKPVGETRDGRKDQPIMAHRGTAEPESDNVGVLPAPGMEEPVPSWKVEGKSFENAKGLRYA
jgi:hypothetical protein